MLPLNEYQKQAFGTAKMPVLGHPVVYPALGLAGEAGEVLENVKKAFRDDGEMTAKRRDNILLELGDVLWYVAAVATVLDLSLEEIAEENLKKLARRHKMEKPIG